MSEAAPHILLVDDDDALLRFAGKYLTRMGYKVEEGKGAEAAWALFERAPCQHALAFVDLTMRDGSGQELAARMLAGNPDLKIVLWSGYPFDPARFSEEFPKRVEFLLKPFTPAMLAGTVKRLIGGQSSSKS